MKPILNLKTTTPEQISAAVAEHVAGEIAVFVKSGAFPPYATSADAVLPLLQPCRCDVILSPTGAIPCRVELVASSGAWVFGDAPTFPLAACIALLRAHGVEVEG